jgi:hypothetical protein
MTWESLTEHCQCRPMLSPQQHTLLESMQAHRFREALNLTIKEIIVILNDHKLTLYARKPSVVDRILNHIAEIKQQAWIICGAESVKLFCYGEIVSEFATRDILVCNADVKPATPMTITLEPVVAENNAPTPALEQTIENFPIELYTIDELSRIAQKVGFDAQAIEAEIKAINPKPFARGKLRLYPLEVVDQAIQNVSRDAMLKARSIALVEDTTETEKAPAPPRAKKPATASRTKKKTTPKVTATAE